MPEPQQYAVGMLFLPQEINQANYCSDIFEKEIGGSSKLVSLARQAKLTKVIIITESKLVAGIDIQDDLGGALKRITVEDFTDPYSLELIFYESLIPYFYQN